MQGPASWRDRPIPPCNPARKRPPDSLLESQSPSRPEAKHCTQLRSRSPRPERPEPARQRLRRSPGEGGLWTKQPGHRRTRGCSKILRPRRCLASVRRARPQAGLRRGSRLPVKRSQQARKRRAPRRSRWSAVMKPLTGSRPKKPFRIPASCLPTSRHAIAIDRQVRVATPASRPVRGTPPSSPWSPTTRSENCTKETWN